MRDLHRLQAQKYRRQCWQYAHFYGSLCLGMGVLTALGVYVTVAIDLPVTIRFWGVTSGFCAVMVSLLVSNYGNYLVHLRLQKRQEARASTLISRLNYFCLGLRSPDVCRFPVLLGEAQLLSLELLPLGKWYAERVEFRLTQSVLENLLAQCQGYV